MYINTNFLHGTWPLPHKMLNSVSIPQTFSVTCRIALSASWHSYKTWMSRARAINEKVIRHTSPTRGQSTLEKWHSAKGVVTTHFPSSEEQTTLSPKHSSQPRYDLSSYINAYFHPNYLYQDQIWGMCGYVNSHRNLKVCCLPWCAPGYWLREQALYPGRMESTTMWCRWPDFPHGVNTQAEYKYVGE